MCRFLLVRSKNKIKPEKLLKEFALLCKKSKAPDGDWQGDGYGVAWRMGGKWELKKSLIPIWDEINQFKTIPETNLFVAHARSSGFPGQKGIIEYNQPYIEDSLCFVFNGMIRGVKLSMPLDGKIGAQKIFSLLRSVIPSEVEESIDVPSKIMEALRYVDRLIIDHSKKVEGMNIGLVRDDKFYVLCEYEKNTDYFSIKYYRDDKLTLVCSEPIGSYQWRIMNKSEILVL